MMGRTHKRFALATTLAYFCIRQTDPSIGTFVSSATAFASAGLPDLDIIGKRYNIPILKTFKHRGITHSVWAMLPFLFLLWAHPNNPIILGLTIGYVSHIIADAFSYMGVAFFYPITGYVKYPSGGGYVKGRRIIFKPLYRTGSKPLGIRGDVFWGWVSVALSILHLYSLLA